MYLQLFGSLGCVILSCTSMRKMLLEILDDETGFLKKKRKQDSYLGNVEFTGETLSKFQ